VVNQNKVLASSIFLSSLALPSGQNLNSALKTQCHVVKNTLLRLLFRRFCPLGKITNYLLLKDGTSLNQWKC